MPMLPDIQVGCVPTIIYHPGSSKCQSEEETFPSLNQTGESSSSDLNLGHSPSTFRTQPSKSRQCVGGRAHFFSTGVQGPLTWLFSLFCLLELRDLLESILLCWGSVSCRHKSSTKPRTRQADRRRSSHHPSSITQDPPGPKLKRKPSPV